MNTLTDWLKNHQLLYTFILFLLSAAFSLYAKDIRRFLHEWPKTKETARQVKRDKAAERLRLLQLLHNDSYQLLLYFSIQFMQIVLGCLISAAILFVISLFREKPFLTGIYVGAWAGIFLGRLDNLRSVVSQLTRYDSAVAGLQQKASGS
jgi:hypothetical protein